MDILRFITAGSVDDGKSTLIGRLLYDSKSILIDQLEAIEKASEKKGSQTPDLSLLTDGLRAEREQGITIDVAYKYFHTPKRKFIIADCPGHVQYTRNMVTGASNSDLAIILIDARHGVVEQTSRHIYIASLLGIRHLAVCVNKMDLMSYSQEVYDKIVADCTQFISNLRIPDVVYIPISALFGDNIVDKSESMDWYKGGSLLEHLESVELHSDFNANQTFFPVQYVIRPQTTELHDYRGYAGRISSGLYKKGDSVTVLPSGFESTIKAIEINGKEIEQAFAPMSVILHLEDDIDISRGDVIVKSEYQPQVSREIEVDLCWLDTKMMNPREKYLLLKNGAFIRCIVKEIAYKVNVNTTEKIYEDKQRLQLNDMARVTFHTATSIVFEDYQKNRAGGSCVLVDPNSNLTVAACMIVKKSYEPEFGADIRETYSF
ncbi:MAG: sulfate adenylyltransferase [Bacteroidetes bacterium]|nr:MAG: sulfate adenylyltransferase [Bacteroidota bacterium]